MSVLILKLLLISIFAGWISIWVLKPTEFWTRKLKVAEEKATASSIFRYNGLDFIVYAFPLIALAIIGYIYLELKQTEPINRQRRRRNNALTCVSNRIYVNRVLGILSGAQILVSSLFIVFLVWTFYARVSNDFKKMTPVKTFKLSIWEYKFFRMSTRCGLLSEVCLSFLLLPVLRGMSIFRILNIQLEASVRYHIWLGNATIFFATLHGAGTFFIWGIKHQIQHQMWKWQKKGRIYLAGEIALITGLIIWITSFPQIRRKWFRVFYYTHHLFIVFLVSFLFHGGDRHFYIIFPGVFLFALDKMLRILQSRTETCVISARVFPCRAVELTLPKDPRLKYTPTSVIFLKIPSISKFEWHPFSITSSSKIDEDTISVIIKSEGKWTTALYNKINGENDSEVNRRVCIKMATEGPYGPASLDFLRYDNLLLVAGGIGVTPFLSILREISSNTKNGRNGYPDRIQLIYTIKKSQDICLLDPILPQLLNIEKFRIKLKVFVTQENQIGATLREVINEIPETRIINFSTKCTSYAIYGSERLLWIAAITMASSIKFLLSLVFFNHIFTPQSKKPLGQKSSSSKIDLLLMCSFGIAILSSILMAVVIRWKRLKKGVRLFSDNKQSKDVKRSILEASRDFDEHEIHFGGRPNFQDILSKFASETEGSNIGVLVCGPEQMKESVASSCRQAMMLLKNAKGKKPHFNFHSLNFTL